MVYSIAFSSLLALAAAFPTAPTFKNQSTPAQTQQLAAAASGDYWYSQIDHSTSHAPFAQDPDNYQVYKTISNAGDLQGAINDGGNGDRPGMWVVSEPRVVYIPSGNYALSSTLNFKTDTVLIGDANNPPTISAADGFDGNALINGQDSSVCNDDGCRGELSFSCMIKNVILDTTGVDASQDFAGLLWSVAQNCALSNVKIVMPQSQNGNGHKGIQLERGSTISVSDVRVENGLYGIYHKGHQQAVYKSIYFYQNTEAFHVDSGNTVSLLGCTFDTVGTGVHHVNSGVWISIVDATVINSGPAFSSDQYPNFMIENLSQSGSTNPIAVVRGDTVIASAATVGTYWYGNTADGNPIYETGNKPADSTVPSSLKPNNGKYYYAPAPSYANVSIDSFINIKDSNQNGGQTVTGDGSTNDGPAINKVLATAASSNKIVFFPFGVYVTEETIEIPPGSQIVGEGWSTISGRGDAFSSADMPTAVVQVGKSGDVGKAQIQDMRFTVADVLPGAKIVEVNMAGNAPGDVAIWNSPITIGGTPDSAVDCGDASNQCQAAFIGLHLTASSSAYIDNMWVWTADHSLDGSSKGCNIATGRGVLVEATKGTWIAGLGSEHHWLYNLAYNKAENVFMGFLQSETNYDQGSNAAQQMPAPWTPDTDNLGDPDYSWCDGDDSSEACNMALAQYINGGSNIFSYAEGSWAFFNGGTANSCGNDKGTYCQGYMNAIGDKPSNLNLFGLGVRAPQYILRQQDGTRYAQDPDFTGSWSGLIAAFMSDAGSS